MLRFRFQSRLISMKNLATVSRPFNIALLNVRCSVVRFARGNNRLIHALAIVEIVKLDSILHVDPQELLKRALHSRHS